MLRRCPDCGTEIAEGLRTCPGCAKLLYAAELQALAKQAEAAEQQGDRTAALTAWRRALELLPPGTVQGKTIQARMQGLSAAIDGRGQKQASTGKRGAWAAIAAAGAAALLKAKALVVLLLANIKLLALGLLKLPTLLSMLYYASVWGHDPWLAGGVVASIYVHEIGHVATLQRYGIAASAPMFVPGFGALVRLRQYPTDAHEEARTGLAGPIWGLAAAIVAAAIGWLGHLPVALHVASWGATINAFNLVPVWQLDGSRGLKALARHERIGVGLVGLAVALVFHQAMSGIVGALTLARAWERSAHPKGDREIALTFIALLVLLGALALLPGGTL
jgi:Zn-dependent protease